MKTIGFLLAGLVLATQANATPGQSGGRYTGDRMLVIMRAGANPIPLVTGDNLLDRPQHFDCNGASGCIVIMNSAVKVTNGVGIRVCSAVDGTSDGAPECFDSLVDGITVSRRQVKIHHGRHTVSTSVHSDNPVGQIDNWEADYTVYEID